MVTLALQLDTYAGRYCLAPCRERTSSCERARALLKQQLPQREQNGIKVVALLLLKPTFKRASCFRDRNQASLDSDRAAAAAKRGADASWQRSSSPTSKQEATFSCRMPLPLHTAAAVAAMFPTSTKFPDFNTLSKTIIQRRGEKGGSFCYSPSPKHYDANTLPAVGQRRSSHLAAGWTTAPAGLCYSPTLRVSLQKNNRMECGYRSALFAVCLSAALPPGSAGLSGQCATNTAVSKRRVL